MSDPFFSTFKSAVDHNNWEKHIEYASKKSDIDKEVQAQWINSLKFLQNELGNGFLKSSSPSHAIRQKITNKADWQIGELIDFTITLKWLKEYSQNYEKLRRKLIPDASSIKEGIPFVDITGSYIKSGFVVDFIEEKQSQKTPDIKLIHSNGDVVYIEVSRLDHSNEVYLLQKNHHVLLNKLHHYPPFFPYSCIQLRPIFEEEMPSTISKIEELKSLITSSKEPISYKDDKIDLIFYPLEKVSDLEDYCIKENRRMALTGAPIRLKEIDRIINNKKLIDKANQLPKESVGILYIHMVNPMFLSFTNIDKAIVLLQKQLNQFPNLLGIVLYSYKIDLLKEMHISKGPHLIQRKVSHGAFNRDLLFISNESFNMSVHPETLSSLYSALQ